LLRLLLPLNDQVDQLLSNRAQFPAPQSQSEDLTKPFNR